MMLLAPFALLFALSFTQAAVISSQELAAPFHGDRLSIMPAADMTSADTLDARATQHHDCEYSGIIPGVWFSGHCQTGAHYPNFEYAGVVGQCVVPGLIDPQGKPVTGVLCDIRWAGGVDDPVTQRGCTGWQDSQFACKHDGDSCQIYHLPENQTLGVAHCQWPGSIIN